MWRLSSWLVLSMFSFAASALSVRCPEPNEVRITDNWALTAKISKIDWDGSLAKDATPLGKLETMDVVFAPWLNGYVVRCVYRNGTLSTVGPIKGTSRSKGILHNCSERDCVATFS